jgi:hypothetical protein
MHEGEELHRLEQKALATARRLAVQKEHVCHSFASHTMSLLTLAVAGYSIFSWT